MTKTEELYRKLQELGIPVAYQEFKSEQAPPYIAYFADEEDSITADGESVLSVVNVEIHLLTSKGRDLAKEKTLENALRSLKTAWHKDLDWDTREKIFDIIYSIELIEGE